MCSIQALSMDAELRFFILSRDQFKCQKCGSKFHLEIHHIYPKSKGGKNIPSNLVTLCIDCHGRVHGQVRHLPNWKYKRKLRNKLKRFRKKMIRNHRKRTKTKRFKYIN